MMIYILIIYPLVAIWTLITYKIKNSKLLWFSIICPPFTLLPLIWVPIDIVIITIWLAAYLLLLISAVCFIVRLIAFLLTKNPETKKRLSIRLIRPALTILIILMSHALVNLSLKSADEYAKQIAEDVQSQCVKNGQCPTKLEGWKFDDEMKTEQNHKIKVFEKSYGKYGTKYKISYYIFEYKQEFLIYVRHNIDSGFSIFGGVNKKLEFK